MMLDDDKDTIYDYFVCMPNEPKTIDLRLSSWQTFLKNMPSSQFLLDTGLNNVGNFQLSGRQLL